MSRNTSKITLHDYSRQYGGQDVITYTIKPEACERFRKKRMSGVPKSIIVHMPTTEEGIRKLDGIYIKYAEKAAAKSLGAD